MIPTGRLVRAGLAAALGLVVLSGTGGTSAAWVESAEREPGTIRAGGVTVRTPSARIELHSRQPSGSRTYASTSTCTPDSGFTQCRVITSTVAQESLVPGDRVVITARPSLSADGDNLTGSFEVRASQLTSGTLSELSGSATATTTATSPTGESSTGRVTTFPVSVASGRGIGTYTVRTVITSPPDSSGTPWGTRLTGQQLYDGTFDYTFTQS